jgi:hypothetical protein
MFYGFRILQNVILPKPEPMISCDNICFMNAFDTLNYVDIWIDYGLWDLKYDYEIENWDMI